MVVGGMELNSLNCIVLSLVLAATLLTYLLMGCLIVTMGAAIKPDSGYNLYICNVYLVGIWDSTISWSLTIIFSPPVNSYPWTLSLSSL